REIPASYRVIFTNPLAKFCFGGVLMEGIFLFGIFPYVATLLHQIGEQRASIAGLVIAGFGLGGILYSFVIPWALPRLGQSRLMFTGGVLMVLGLMALSFLPPWQVQFTFSCPAWLRVLFPARRHSDFCHRARSDRA